MAATTALSAGLLAGPFAAPALPETTRSLNFYGVPGVIDMPSGEALPDAEIAATVSSFAGLTRTTLSFQISPRITGSFRYARFANWNTVEYPTYYDRSFDLRFRILDESGLVPSVTIGLQDFLGTGISSAEYIVATKHLGERLKVTAGLGWGRLGSSGSIFDTGTRPEGFSDATGGTPNAKNWFRGPAAPFAGIEWQATDKLTLKAEYSSDIYDIEDRVHGILDRRSPYNFGAEYQITQAFRVGAYYMYGSAVGLSAQILINPKRGTAPGTVAKAPLPVKPRTGLDAESWGTDWASDAPSLAKIREVTAKAMANDGMVLEAMEIRAHSATIRLINPRYDAEPMAIGRALRALTYILPPSVETISVVPVVNGIPSAAITVRRSDLERYEHAADGTEQMFTHAVVSDGAGKAALPQDRVPGLYPRLSYSLAPYASVSLFDPQNALAYTAGLRAKARYELVPGFILRGTVSARLADNLTRDSKPSDSVLPHVRSDAREYYIQSKTAVEELTASYYFRPGADLYGRVTAGYLERMFGGVSAEILWKPVDSAFALGAELNWVKQRDFDGGFGFQDYSVVTGHVSGYYAFGDGYHVEVDAGRYLAGDWGATVALDREFANGWRIGGFATFTDVSFNDFGEGSFDKGIRVQIPLSWALGKPDRSKVDATLHSLSRDGGQRLEVGGRLYESVRDYHELGLSQEWGLFWR